MAARNYSNIAIETTLNGSITNIQTTCTLTADTGWPAVPFTMEIENEVVLVTARTGTSITTMTRGYDGTSNVAHNDGVLVRTVVVAADFDLIWDHSAAHADGGDDEIDVVSLGSGAQGASFMLETDGSGGLQWTATPAAAPLTTKGDLLGYDTGIVRIPVSTDGLLLMADSGDAQGVAWSGTLDYPYRFDHANGITFGAAGDAQLRLLKFTDTYQIQSGNDANAFTTRIALNTTNHATEASDIIVYNAAGSPVLRWDESNSYWSIDGANLIDTSSIVFGDQNDDRVSMSQNSTERWELNWIEDAVSNRPVLTIFGPAFGASDGDILWQSPDDGANLLRWDESDDRWEFLKNVDFTGQTITGFVFAHASTHSDGGTDEIDVVDLGSGAQGGSFVLETDGAGGLQWTATPATTDPDAIHDNVSGEINAITSKTSPTTSDLLLIEDAAASNAKKKITIGTIPRQQTLAFSHAGDLETGTGVFRLPMDYAGTIISARAMVSTAPTGASAIFDINLNGTTIFSTQANRPTIAASGTDSGSDTPNTTSFSAGDYFTVDIDQIGSTIAGANAVVVVVIEPS